MGILDYILLFISILLIVIIVLQSSKDDLSKAFSGEKSELFANQKQRGFEKIISYSTAGLSAAFFLVSFVLLLIL